jgi:hypothetical protein
MTGKRTAGSYGTWCPECNVGIIRDESGEVCVDCALARKDQTQANAAEAIRKVRELALNQAHAELTDEPKLRAYLQRIAFEGKWPDGTKVENEQIRMQAARLLKSEIPKIAVAKFASPEEKTSKELKIRLRLDGLPDPTVSRERLEQVHATMLDPPKDNGDGE